MKYFLIFLLACPFVLSAQYENDCRELLQMPLPIDLETRQWDSESLLNGTSLLLRCYFDEYDRKALAKTPFRNFLFQLSVQDFERPPTYNDMRLYFNEATAEAEYQRVKQGGEVVQTFGNTIADTATFRQDIQLIRGIVPSQELLEELYLLTVEHQGQGKTYGYLLDLHQAGMEIERNQLPDPFRALDYEGGPFPFDTAMALANESGKPLLIFFTGYACLNGLKMQDYRLAEPDIRQTLLNDFICLRLYVDSRIELEPEYQITLDGDPPRKIRNVGQRVSLFQQQQFGTNFQPYLVILDTEGNILAELQYTMDTDEIRAFLEAGL